MRQRHEQTASSVDSQRRRRILQSTGLVGTAALAGCIGGNRSDDENETVTLEDGEYIDQPFVSAQGTPIENLQFNSYNNNNLMNNTVLFDRLVYYQKDVDEFQPGVITDWQVEDEKVTLDVREGVPWHDGGEVTAADVVRKLKLNVYTGGPLGNYVSADTIIAADDRTVELGLDRPISEEIILSNIVGLTLDVPEEHFQPFLDDFEDGGDGVNEDGEDLTTYELAEPNGTGPFAFSERTEQELVLQIVEDHPDAENINFPEYHFQYMSDNQSQWQALESGTIDGVPILFAPPNIVNGFPDSVREYQITPNWGVSITWNHDHKHFSQRKVRQAIAHIVNREEVANNSGPRTKYPVDIPTGIVGNIDTGGETLPANEWLGDNVDAYESYQGQNEDVATELLESAGFQRDDGTWYDGDGDVLEFSVKAPGGWSDYVDAIQTFNQHLNDFGIEAEFVARDQSVYFGEDLFGDAGFDVAMFQWTTGYAYPYFNYQFLFDSSEQKEVRRYPDEIELPPVGEPDGETETYVPAEDVEKLATVEQGSDEERELVQQLAWAFNYDLPALPLQETVDQSFLVTDGWEAVTSDDSDAHIDWPVTYLPRVGKLTAKED
ncbi:ABC transporter substrate-binding protein [Halomontanus rarus]|uniref:ABC transporter substrate-binding protein n=1 Tax=Halomontanus rarus TaxID=3034020 RepID=UPI0023E8DB61|nr:ABC transporter substrate-binding protein [Halovivax sp. TS33]